MRKLLPALALLAGCVTSSLAAGTVGPLSTSHFVPIDAYTQTAMLGRGINLPLEHGATLAKYMKTIHDAGFRTLRLLTSSVVTKDPRGVPDDSWFENVDAMLNAALQQGLIVVLDQNVSEACQSAPDACTERLSVAWSAIASHYRNAPNSVLFELVDEPHAGFTASTWNQSLRKILRAVRATNPDRNVVIGPVNWSMPAALADLRLPRNDRHIIVTFHYYLPIEFASQGKHNRPTGVGWGTPADYDFLHQQFDAAKSWSEWQHRPLFMGEFGVFEAAAEPDRVRWLRAVVRTANEHRIPWCFWQFGSDYRGYDFDREQWNSRTMSILMPEQNRGGE